MKVLAKTGVFLLILMNGFICHSESGAELVEYVTKVTLKGGKLTYEVKVGIQINSREGEDYTYVNIPFSKANVVKSLDAWISDLQFNVVRRLKKSEIQIQSAVSEMALYEDEFVKAFQLKHNVYPYQLHYSYSVTYSNFVNIVDWYPTIGRLPSRGAQLMFEVDDDSHFSTFQRSLEEPKVSTIENARIYTWEANDIVWNVEEEYSPGYEELLPTVKITPSSFRYGLNGSLESWKDFGNWQFNTNNGLRDLPDSEKRAIDLLLSGVSDKREKIKKLYYYLQDHTRYILVVEGIGGLKPYPASYVANNKYGDCKALTNYMMAMLEYIGVPSYYTKVKAGNEVVPLISELPGQQFNHVFVTVPLAGDTLWLECTNKYTPFNYMGTFTQNREALMVTENDSRIIRTPALKPHQISELRKIKGLLTDNGMAELQLEFELRGESFELFLQLMHDYTRAEQEKYISAIVPYSEFELLDWHIDRRDRDDDFVNLSVNLTTHSFAKKYGDQLIIKPVPFDVPNLKTPEKREYPLVLHYPIQQIDSIEIKLAENLQVAELPKAERIEKGSSFFETVSTSDGRMIKLSRAWTLQSDSYAGNDYKAIYGFLQTIKNNENSSAIVVKRR